MEYKVLVAQPKVIEGRTVRGLASVFGNVDGGGDRIIRGAFKKTIKENGRRVRHLWMHDPYQPPTAVVKELVEVGVEDLPDEIRKASPEATGGLEVVREYLDTPRGDEILEGIKSGAIGEMSIGYSGVKFDFEEMKDGDLKGMMVRNLREIRLWDTSDVTWGMNELTVASKGEVGLVLRPVLEKARRGMSEEEFGVVEGMAGLLEKVMGRSGDEPQMNTDEHRWGKAGRVLSARNLERLRGAMEVLSEILLAAEPVEDEDEKAYLLSLTEQVRSRIAIAERELFLIGGLR